MAGLFDGAEFGDKYKTRGGYMAIYALTYGDETKKCVKMMVKFISQDKTEHVIDIIVDSVTGKRIYGEETEMDRFDIVSRWED